MSHAFSLAVKEWEWVKDNPVKRVRMERANNTIERWLSEEEEERLLMASPQWLQDVIVFAIHTGLRRSELPDLKRSQLNLERRNMTIHKQKYRYAAAQCNGHECFDTKTAGLSWS